MQYCEELIGNDQLKESSYQDQGTVFPKPSQTDRQGTRTRFLGLFAALWVGLALQPCAVAAVAEHDCPHCPPQAEEAAVPQKSHCDPVARAEPVESPQCDAMQADCCDLEQGTLNVRVDNPDGDGENAAFPASEPAPYPDPGRCANPGLETGPPEPCGAPVPLHVLKCVYLD